MRVTFQRIGEKTYRLTGADTDRWAESVKRDRGTYLLRRSDGVMCGGALSFWFVQGWMLRWVGEGR